MIMNIAILIHGMYLTRYLVCHEIFRFLMLFKGTLKTCLFAIAFILQIICTKWSILYS